MVSGWGAPPARVLVAAALGWRGALSAEAVTLAGGEPAPIGFDALTAEALAAAPAVLVEAEGAPPETLDSVLALLAAHAPGPSTIVAFTFDQLDHVAAHLLGSRAELLCAPSDVERVAALSLALATQGSNRLREEGDASDADRLRRLSGEVARIAEALARISRGEPDLLPLATPVSGYRGEHDGVPTNAGDIRRLIRQRRLRDQYFPGGLFEDPAWDMLLDLFAAELEGTNVSVSSLCIAASVAPTTALRWINRLTAQGLFVRLPDAEDRRRAFIRLGNDASVAMHGYWAAAARLPV